MTSYGLFVINPCYAHIYWQLDLEVLYVGTQLYASTLAMACV